MRISVKGGASICKIRSGMEKEEVESPATAAAKTRRAKNFLFSHAVINCIIPSGAIHASPSPNSSGREFSPLEREVFPLLRDLLPSPPRSGKKLVLLGPLHPVKSEGGGAPSFRFPLGDLS